MCAYFVMWSKVEMKGNKVGRPLFHIKNLRLAHRFEIHIPTLNHTLLSLSNKSPHFSKLNCDSRQRIIIFANEDKHNNGRHPLFVNLIASGDSPLNTYYCNLLDKSGSDCKQNSV